MSPEKQTVYVSLGCKCAKITLPVYKTFCCLQTSTLLPAVTTTEPVNMLEKCFLSLDGIRARLCLCVYVLQDNSMGTVRTEGLRHAGARS